MSYLGYAHERYAAAWLNELDGGLDAVLARILDPEIVQLLGSLSGQRVLEICSRNGRFSALMQGAHQVWCCEPNPGLLEAAGKRGLMNVRRIPHDATKPLPSGWQQFDRVVSHLSLDMFSDAELPKVMENLHARMTHGGRVLFSLIHPNLRARMSGLECKDASQEISVELGNGAAVTHHLRTLRDYARAIKDAMGIVPQFKVLPLDGELPEVLQQFAGEKDGFAILYT